MEADLLYKVSVSGAADNAEKKTMRVPAFDIIKHGTKILAFQ